MNKASLYVLLLCLPGLTGCSVGMAAHGYPEPDLSVLRVGASRGEVELQPFTALKQTTDDRGYTTVVYEYHIGGEGSAGRAVGWAIADVLTLEVGRKTFRFSLLERRRRWGPLALPIG